MSDATPAYRGYRLQTLYTLSRILESGEGANRVFHPEGAEDLAIWETNNCLLETIQVKAYSTNLSLSVLDPEKPDSFLYRVDGLLSKHPEMGVFIASFGNVGPELFKATLENGEDRKKVVQKIVKYGFLSEESAERLLEQLEIVLVVESELEEIVFTALGNLCTGVDPKAAFDLLNFWLYVCAENKTQITQEDVIQRVNSVGQFISEREAYHSEWFRSIVPIVNDEINAQDQARLENEFYRGVSARYEHILAEVDKPRVNKLNEIAHKFEDNQVVIIHEASGQGKSTIAYRYLHNFFPDQWRFQITVIENRQQAVNIATALSGQAKAIGIPIAVYLDVSPRDVGWDEVVKQLTSQKNIKVLVTVREEDFRRASISGAEIQFAEVELKFERSEAEEIYQFLSQSETPDRFLDFDDAWNRFGGNGPLMEFVYLVTQGNSLRERLQQQVRRIQDEIISGQSSDAKLRLLRLVSVASAFEARLKLRELVCFLQLPSPQRTLELLEEEYLLRTNEGGTLVEGLHPIRSAILTDILTDQTFNPLVDIAGICLPFIFEQDVGSFLLYAFLRPTHELESLLLALENYQPHRWVAISGSIRALIWLGIKEYVEENQSLILEAYDTVNQAWIWALNFDITDASPGMNDIWTSSLSGFMSEEFLDHIDSFRNRQTAKERVFTRSFEWISNLNHEPFTPESDLDWGGLSESLFWKGRLQAPSLMLNWLDEIDISTVVDDLTLETLADLLLGLFYASESTYRSFLDVNYNALLRRFRQETQTLALEDDEQNIRAHFAISLFQEKDSLSKASTSQAYTPKAFLNASMERLRLLRNFFPDRNIFGSKGYGHLIWLNAEMHDETEKNIPQQNYPLPKLVQLNATFKALGEKSLRSVTWEGYAQTVMHLRQQVLRVLEQLNRGLSVFFRNQEITLILGNYVESELWADVRQSLYRSPSLPQCAFDEWGFITEKINHDLKFNDDVVLRQNLALDKYSEYSKKVNEYIRTISNFFQQAELTLNVHPYMRNDLDPRVGSILQELGDDVEQKAKLSVLNLADAWKTLPDFQNEFRKLLAQFVSDQDLNEAERLERRLFKSTWCSWYFFAFHPKLIFQDSIRECIQSLSQKNREIKSCIRQKLRHISSDRLHVEILSGNILWNNEKSLWIKVDGQNILEVYGAIESVITAIQEAIHSVQNDELRRYAIEFWWTNIIVLPLVREKSLDSTAWRFSSILFSVNPNHEFSQWNFMRIGIPDDASSELALQIWQHPHLLMMQKFTGLIFSLSLLVEHISDFDRLPELDEQGEELLQQHIHELLPFFEEVLQALREVGDEICGYYYQLTATELKSRLQLTSAMQMLSELNKQLSPLDDYITEEGIEVSMILEETDDWKDRLTTARQTASVMYLSWASDVLEEVFAT